jgi:hypothetical protein
MGRNPLKRFFEKKDIWDNFVIPSGYDHCPCCGVDLSEIFGMGHQACCFYGSGRNFAGAKEFRRKMLDNKSKSAEVEI